MCLKLKLALDMANSLNSHFFVVVFILSLLAFSSNAQLSPTFYAKTCPNVQTIVSSAMRQAVAKEARIGASILRLFFHDCFVNVKPLATPSLHLWLTKFLDTKLS